MHVTIITINFPQPQTCQGCLFLFLSLFACGSLCTKCPVTWGGVEGSETLRATSYDQHHFPHDFTYNSPEYHTWRTAEGTL